MSYRADAPAPEHWLRFLSELLEPEERALLGKDCTLPALMAWARGEMES